MAKKTLTQATYAVNNIQNQPDQVVGSASALKLAFDQGDIDGKTFINGTLLSELADETLNNSGSNAIGHNSTSVTADNVGDALEEIKTQANTSVQTSGDQTVNGVKDFASSPLVPTPTLDGQAANKSYVDGLAPLNIPNDSLTEAKMAAEMKKQAGGVYPYDLGVIPKQMGGGLIINGNFDIWQRGASFAVAGTVYTTDRLIVSSANVAVDRITNTSPAKSKYTLKFTGAGFNYIPFWKLENPNNVLKNKKSAFSFWVKGSASLTAQALLRNATQGVTIDTKTYNITTDWTKIEIEFAESSFWNTDDVIELRLANSISDLNAVLEYTQCKFEVGTKSTEFVPKTVAEELRDCQRYYEKSYNVDIPPGSVTDINSVIEWDTRNNAGFSNGQSFKVSKRVSPTVTLYSTSGAASSVKNNGDKTAFAGRIGQNGFGLVQITGGDTTSLEYHWVADAEL